VSIPLRHPELDSGSSHRGKEGSPLTPTLSCTSLRIQAHKTRPSSVRFASSRARGKNAAFTLAEVLITLAIIGVVAVMTIPTLINSYEKNVTVTKLRKFHSMMNQAIRLSEVDNGHTSSWGINTDYRAFDAQQAEEFYNNYLANYIRSNEIKRTRDGVLITMLTGDAFGIYTPSDLAFSPHIVYCVDKSSCENYVEQNGDKLFYNGYPLDGKHTFLFVIRSAKGIMDTYFWGDVKTREILKRDGSSRGCEELYKYFCAALIENDGWKISDDYPW